MSEMDTPSAADTPKSSTPSCGWSKVQHNATKHSSFHFTPLQNMFLSFLVFVFGKIAKLSGFHLQNLSNKIKKHMSKHSRWPKTGLHFTHGTESAGDEEGIPFVVLGYSKSCCHLFQWRKKHFLLLIVDSYASDEPSKPCYALKRKTRNQIGFDNQTQIQWTRAWSRLSPVGCFRFLVA